MVVGGSGVGGMVVGGSGVGGMVVGGSGTLQNSDKISSPFKHL